MSKFLQAFLTGVFFTSIFDFLIILGLKLNYMDEKSLFIYYNEFFADNQNIYLFLSITILIGYLVIYVDNNKLSAFAVSLLLIISISTFIKPIGNALGDIIFLHKNVSYSDKKYTYTGDLLYHARESIFFYDYDLQKTILLDTTTLKDFNK